MNAKRTRRQPGEKAALRSVSEAGHLVMLERPRAFNRCLREFLVQQQQQPRATTATAEAGLASSRVKKPLGGCLDAPKTPKIQIFHHISITSKY
jgi:hypothetical protein